MTFARKGGMMFFMMNKALKEKIKEVNRIVDGLGLPVDKKIKRGVAALRLLGFHTTASCEGHDDWGLQYPWIEINNGPEFSLRDTAEKQAMEALLNEFYHGRYFRPIQIARMGIFGGFRLMPYPNINERGDKALIKFDQEQMEKFITFLLKKYEHTRTDLKRLG